MLQVNASSITYIIDTNYTVDTKRKPQITVSSLDFEIDGDTFQGGKARLRCVASLFNLYQAQVEHVTEEERPRPRPSSVFGTRSSSPGGCINNYILFLTLMNVLTFKYVCL